MGGTAHNSAFKEESQAQKGWEQLPWRFRASTEAHWTVWCVDALNYISCFMFHCWCCLMPNSLWAHGNIHNHLSKSGIRKGWVVSTTPAVSDHPLLCIAELKICWQHASCPLSLNLFLFLPLTSCFFLHTVRPSLCPLTCYFTPIVISGSISLPIFPGFTEMSDDKRRGWERLCAGGVEELSWGTFSADKEEASWVKWSIWEEEKQAGKREGVCVCVFSLPPALVAGWVARTVESVVFRGSFWSWAWGLPRLLPQQWQTCVWFLRQVGEEAGCW